MKYKIIADVNSDYKNRLKSYKNFLFEKEGEKVMTFSQDEFFNPEEDMTKDEVDAYNAGWCIAFAVAKHHLDMWFPELTEDNNG